MVTVPLPVITYFIVPGQAPARWIAASSDATTEDIGNTTLPSEITTGFATNPRWFGVYSTVTAPSGTGTTNSSAVLKLDSGVQTANAGNTVAKLGLFQTQNGGNLIFVKKLTTAATLASADTLDASWQLTNS